MRALILVAVLAAVALAKCPTTSATYYTALSALSSCTTVAACNTARTSCFSSAGVSCTIQQQCARNYTDCIGAAAVAASASSGETCDTWGAAAVAQVNAFTTGNSTDWTGTTIYQACASYVCSLINSTCTIGYLYTCPRPSGAPTASPAPIGSIPTLSPEQAKVIVQVQASFAGDFSALFANTTAADEFCGVVSLALATQLGLPADSYEKECKEGSFICNVNVAVAAGDTSTQDAIQSNAANLAENSDTTWLTSLNSQLASACSSCDSLSAPIVASSTQSEEASSSPSDDDGSTCAAGCIAGIVIGATVAVIIIIVAVCVCCRKSEDGTGQKSNKVGDGDA